MSSDRKKTVKLKNGQIVSQEFYDLLMSVSGKRARFVIDTIIENGQCSTEDIKDAGYEHPPRAKRDVVEAGIPITNEYGSDRAGRRMAIYKFDNWEQYKKQSILTKSRGRNMLSDSLKQKLITAQGNKCSLYDEYFPENLLQVDHRIPYEIAGDPEDLSDERQFMLLCPSANRAKSWACEHCENWSIKNPVVCSDCYYASPENYNHIAGAQERRLDIIYRGKDIEIYNHLCNYSKEHGISIQDAFKKWVIDTLVDKKDD